MLPRTLAIASLRQTSRLRRQTGTKRTERLGSRRSEAVFMVPLVAQLAPRQLDEQVLEIGGPVQVAHARVRREIGEKRRRVVRIAERRLAGELETRRERAPARLGPRLRRFAIDLDDFGLDMMGKQR